MIANNLTGIQYADFPEKKKTNKKTSPHIGDVPLNAQKDMWFWHNSTLPNFSW
jgi:hypothetical protein